ncbi:PKD domain-containing protein [Marinoscillum luteum]|uniref:PKD domain-containing protein n=1 Tax=Marinoscillum luteum TaxID=861051 RepID=A0ABW7NBK8_9BACT
MRIFFKNFRILSAALLVALVTVSCTEDEEPIAPPSASFSFEVDATNPLSVTFTNTTLEGETFAWDFGDGAGTSAEENPTYTYSAGGTYSVKLTATNEGGSNEATKEVTVKDAEPQNQIKNGTFDDDSEWTLQQFNVNANADISIASGVLTIGEVNPDAGWGGEAHGGAWQAVTVEAGTYGFDLDITTDAADEFWAEVWVGDTEPVADQDYNAEVGATVVLAVNTWDCGDAQATYSGSLRDNNCGSSDGTITLTAGTYYVAIRAGGITFPAGGVVIDNVSMFAED